MLLTHLSSTPGSNLQNCCFWPAVVSQWLNDLISWFFWFSHLFELLSVLHTPDPLLFFFFPLIFISWRLITSQYCSGFCHTLTWISHGLTCVPHPDPLLLPPSPSHPSGSSQCTSPEYLSHVSNLGWWYVSPLIIYMFQCYSLRSSHSHLLPQTPKVFSIHLCLFLSCI